MTRKKNLDLTKVSKIERRMIEEILALKKREVNKIMVPTNEIISFDYDKTISDVISVYKQQHFSRYPVFFNNIDQMVGVIFIKDIISFWNEYKNHFVIEFVRFPYFIYEDHSALDVFLELQRLRISLGIVIDEFGGVSGIITVEDLIEEIVGEIEDELDKRQKPYIERVSENEYVINTRMELDEFSEYFNMTVDEDDVSTVSGLILKIADRIPKIGEEITYKNLRFLVLEGTRRKISKVKVKKVDSS